MKYEEYRKITNVYFNNYRCSIDCNVFKESIEIPIIVSGITFLLGIYILMLCENKSIK
jgi:hypothetical protein